MKLLCKNCGIMFEAGDSCICKDISDRKWTSVNVEEQSLELEKFRKNLKAKQKRGK